MRLVIEVSGRSAGRPERGSGPQAHRAQFATSETAWCAVSLAARAAQDQPASRRREFWTSTRRLLGLSLGQEVLRRLWRRAHGCVELPMHSVDTLRGSQAQRSGFALEILLASSPPQSSSEVGRSPIDDNHSKYMKIRYIVDWPLLFPSEISRQFPA